MLGSHEDKGARCSKHATEIFLVRCAACESLNREFRVFGVHEAPDAA